MYTYAIDYSFFFDLKSLNFAPMSKIHIGKKIKEVLDKSPMAKEDFATRIGLTRDGAYKILKKESIATDQLQKICRVLDHDFFSYYQTDLVEQSESKYGYASREDVEALAQLVSTLTKEVERMRKDLSKIANATPVVKKKKR